MADKNTKEKKGEDIQVVKKIAEELLSLMGSSADFEVVSDEDNDALRINIVSDEEAGLLIGTRGETITSLQTIVGMIFKNRTDEWKRIIINIADWREKQEEKLTQLAINTAERVKETNQPSPLYNLSAGDRRIIHMALKDNADVITESVGEGKDRHLVVSPRQ